MSADSRLILARDGNQLWDAARLRYTSADASVHELIAPRTRSAVRQIRIW